jgi:hypothetical protein
MSGLEDFDLTLDSDAHIRDPLWMIGPRSYFADRTVPLVDFITVPARSFGKEYLRLSNRTEPSQTGSYHGRRQKLFDLLRANKT